MHTMGTLALVLGQLERVIWVLHYAAEDLAFSAQCAFPNVAATTKGKTSVASA